MIAVKPSCFISGGRISGKASAHFRLSASSPLLSSRAVSCSGAIHRPDKDEKRTVEEARKTLALRHAPLIFALDHVRIEHHSRGATAQQYGVVNYPVVILIDRAGKIAFRSDMTAGDRNVAAILMKIISYMNAMTDEKANRLVEQAIAREIEGIFQTEK